MHLAILTRQIGHYHDARYRGAAAAMDKVTVISTANQGGFAQFLAKDTGAYGVERLFDDRSAYDAAVRSGALRSALEEVLARLAPDAIAISGWSNPESMIAIRWGRRNNVPLVMMSESQGDDAARSFVRETIKKRIVSLCDAALVGGPTHAAYIADLGIVKSRIQMGYNAVDNAHFAAGAGQARGHDAELRKKLQLPGRYMLASCRFIEKKNLPPLISAYAKCLSASSEPLPDLLILGDGEEKSDIVETARKAGVTERVHLPGYRGYEDLPAYYALAELFIHVSTVEQWGLVINEAMASATPALASQPCGAARTLIEGGKTGLITAPDQKSISAALMRFFAMPPQQRVAMGNAGSNAVKEWGPDRFGAGMRAAVENAASAPRRGRIAPWDAAILNRLEKQIVDNVS